MWRSVAILGSAGGEVVGLLEIGQQPGVRGSPVERLAGQRVVGRVVEGHQGAEEAEVRAINAMVSRTAYLAFVHGGLSATLEELVKTLTELWTGALGIVDRQPVEP
jgi:hypothetical protein